MSNRSLSEKKNMEKGFRESHFVNLNAIPARVESWGEKEIVQRRNYLITQSLNIWKFPETEYTPKKDIEDLYEFYGIKAFTNYAIKGYTFKSEDYLEVNSWIDFYLQIVTIITKENPTAIGKIAESKIKTGLDSVFLTQKIEKTTEIIPGIYSKTNLSNQEKISLIRQLFDILEIEYNQLQVEILNHSKRPVIYAGVGTMGHGPAVQELSRKMKAPIITTGKTSKRLSITLKD